MAVADGCWVLECCANVGSNVCAGWVSVYLCEIGQKDGRPSHQSEIRVVGCQQEMWLIYEVDECFGDNIATIEMSGRPRTTSFAEGNKQPLNPPLGGMKISSKSTCFNWDCDGQLVGLGRIARHGEVTFDRNRASLRLRPQQYLPSIQYGCSHSDSDTTRHCLSSSVSHSFYNFGIRTFKPSPHAYSYHINYW